MLNINNYKKENYSYSFIMQYKISVSNHLQNQATTSREKLPFCKFSTQVYLGV